MSLREKLATLKAQNLAKFSEEVKNVFMKDLKRLTESGIMDRIPKVGQKLKEFTLLNHSGEERKLTALRKNGPVIVTFYRGGWCPYCNLQLSAYQDVIEDIKAEGATLVAITPELPDASMTTAERHALEFEVLTDKNSDYARELGIVFTLPEKIRPIYEDMGIMIEEYNGKDHFELPLAATFIVDVDGTVVYAFADTDYTLRAEPSEIVKELKSLKLKK